ncbi:hypothetical protein UFOVP635_17 [uncultured Caudovirales phage]|uniref:Uncharacterized protein n=1 Tax=uncultured Caudovirales phage TaxID=2100421 RepID=A0A6J5N5I2_9CAUD|nr:hypothetical protein UFOVP635_17 [uncultured Caudovirales phage]
MAALLDFGQYIGGNDNIQLEITFPSNQKTNIYNFGESVAGWTFYLDYQTVVASGVTYDRLTGAPNFATTTLIGTFPTGIIDVETYINILDEAAGIVAITIPGGLYTGAVVPDARSHNPITIVGITWTTTDSPPKIQTHRWGLLQSWEPGVPPGDPVFESDYIPVVIGA